MRRSFTIFILLLFPFWANAQWTVQITAGGGPAMELAREVHQIVASRAEYSNGTNGYFGYSYQAGLDVQYFINSRIGIGTGVAYQYSGSKDDLESYFGYQSQQHSSAIKIPVNLLWSPGKLHHSLFRFGLAANIGLMPYKMLNSYVTDEYAPFFSSLVLGYSYQLGKRLNAGILINNDINWYSRVTQYNINYDSGGIENNNTTENFIFNKHFFTAMIILSYRLFGNK
ncbi:MAG: hypothetical protein IH595_12400 [Bacteroidales bacterium]|nr:hypothetical protein [Bacteroidales bacterium]